MKYHLIRTCKCGNTDEIELTKREAAFDLYDSKEIWNSKCSKCGGTKCVSTGLNKPDFDKELILEWGNNSDLYFMEQDEDLMLAEEKYIDVILDIVDNHKILAEKRNILIEALCVLIHDNSKELIDEDLNSEESDSRTKIADRVANELKTRKELVLLAENWIMDYIKEKAFPRIGLEFTITTKHNNGSNVMAGESKNVTINQKTNFWARLKSWWS